MAIYLSIYYNIAIAICTQYIPHLHTALISTLIMGEPRVSCEGL